VGAALLEQYVYNENAGLRRVPQSSAMKYFRISVLPVSGSTSTSTTWQAFAAVR